MKKLTIFIIFLLSNISYADPKNDVETLMRAHRFKAKNLGLLISQNGKTLYELNSKELMIPASLTKILTAGAILADIPLNKKFTTELWSNGTKTKEILKGNLCLRGGGDPSFVSEKMWFLVNEFSRNEIKKVDGDIVIDDSRFDPEIFDAGREGGRVDRAYDAPISAVSFNWNSVNVFVRPGEKVDDPAKVFIDPKNDYIEIQNLAVTTKSGGAKNIEVKRVKVDDHDKIIVAGKISLDSTELVSYKSITNPNLWVGNHLKEFLKEKNIIVSGKIRSGKCDEGGKRLASVESKNMNEMLSDMLKFSNNFVAEMLIKNLAAENNPENPAKMKDGIEAVKKFLDTLNIKRDAYVLENVSGLTRENKLSATQISTVLESIRNNFQVFPEFLAGLPIAGVDGTMKSRLKDNQTFSVRAKTGYLDGIVGLAGFVGRKGKQPLTFVFMFNGGYEEALASRKFFDAIIESTNKWD